MLDKQSRFSGVELFETQHVEKFEVALRVVRGFKNLTSQARENKGKLPATEHTQDFRSEHYGAVEILGELCAIEHDEWTPASRRNSLWCTEAETNKRLVVVAEAQSRVGFDELLDPFKIGWRCESRGDPARSKAREKQLVRRGEMRCTAGRRCLETR